MFYDLLYLSANVAILTVCFYYRHQFKVRRKWFNRSLISMPLWVSALVAAAGFLVNWTPYALEFLPEAILLYWLDEALYQSTGYSIIADPIASLRRKLGFGAQESA